MGEEHTIMLDPMAPPSPCIGVSSPSHATDSGGEQFVSLNGNGTTHGTESHEARAHESHKFESQSIASEEETDNNLSKMKSERLEEEERDPELPVDLKQENNFELESSSPLVPAPDAPQEESAEKPSQELEQEAGLQAQERAKMREEEKHEEEAPAELNLEKQEELPEVPDVVDVVKQDEIPVASDEQQQEIQGGGEVMKQEVAHRSHILGSLSKLDENSARQLLNDSGWNVSQSVRMNGKTQWYYRSPPPKPVLMGSLTSAVAMWKRLADEEHKRKGGGDDDLYPMVTSFLNNVKRPASKKRKRGRYTD